jgi:imidazolonepropionase-like amidohydrolase
MRPAGILSVLATALALGPAPLLLAAEPPDPTLILLADRLLDVRAGRIVQDAALAVSGERIAYAGPASDLPAAAGVTVLDLGDVTLLPGLMDLHTHLTAGGAGPR